MREIKFRAYDPVLGIKEVEDISFCGGYCCVIGNDGQTYELNIKICCLMQYTGLKDKNGKEIYEGDIVRYENTNYEYLESKGIGLIQTDSHSHSVNGFSCRDIKTKYYVRLLCGSLLFSIEIIGNIYENPELSEEITAETSGEGHIR